LPAPTVSAPRHHGNDGSLNIVGRVASAAHASPGGAVLGAVALALLVALPMIASRRSRHG
jgi:hypothetical protein